MFSHSIIIGPSCTHIKKGTDQALLKKLSGHADWTSCQDCKHEDNKENISNSAQQQQQQKEEEEEEEDQEIVAAWMCLKCGHRVSLLVWVMYCITNTIAIFSLLFSFHSSFIELN